MKKKIFLISLFLLTVQTSFSQENKVYVAKIEGMIDLGLAPYIERIVKEAGENSAKAIIFKINTFGGRVDAATQIKDAIINSSVPTIAFIDKRAISAGALISLSCDNIVMVPGASIGATTVVDQSGRKVSEKAQSYMRAEMRATAERRGRRKDIAEAMVDESISIPGLVDSTKLLTLTYEEAEKYGIADTVLSSINEVLKWKQIKNAKLIIEKSNWAEDFVRFLSNPIVSSLLIMIGLVGLFAEIKTPGWGVPGTAAVIALALFFGSGYILKLASIIEIIIFIVGVILLLVEIFVIPGFGIFGILGIIFMIGGLFLGLISDFPLVDSNMLAGAVIQLASSFVIAAFVIYLLTKFLPKSKTFGNLILQTNINQRSGYTSNIDLEHLLNKKGKAITVLRPSGIAIIEDKRYDVVTEGDYINKGTKIMVTKIEGSKIVVKKV